VSEYRGGVSQILWPGGGEAVEGM